MHHIQLLDHTVNHNTDCHTRYFSVDPEKFGTMFSCELDFTVHAIPMYFSKEEIVEECESKLGLALRKSCFT